MSLDLKNAFDTINHAILIGKLSKYGIQNIPVDWIQSYLKDRKQHCTANGLHSGTRAVTYGIQQGSCLGHRIENHAEDRLLVISGHISIAQARLFY